MLEGPNGATPFVQEVVTFETGPAHLFRVVADLEPGATYAVIATDAEGATARARVQMPPPHDPPVLIDGVEACPVTFTYNGTEPVVDAFVTYRTYPSEGPPSLPARAARFSGAASSSGRPAASRRRPTLPPTQPSWGGSSRSAWSTRCARPRSRSPS